MEDQWLAWAKRLSALAETGRHYTRDGYDAERYVEIARIAHSMLSELGSRPIERIEGLVSDAARGYSTPKVDVRAAVLRSDRVLLVREASDGLWTLPGGFADVGFSPIENACKEVREEAGIDVRVLCLYGVRHKARHAYRPDVRDFYKLFYACEPTSDAMPVADGAETLDAAYFSLDALPELSTGRVITPDVEAAFRFDRETRTPLFLD